MTLVGAIRSLRVDWNCISFPCKFGLSVLRGSRSVFCHFWCTKEICSLANAQMTMQLQFSSPSDAVRIYQPLSTRYSPLCLVHSDIFWDDSCIRNMLREYSFTVFSKLSFLEWDPNYFFYFLGALYLLSYDSLKVNCIHFSGYYQRDLKLCYLFHIAFNKTFSYLIGWSRGRMWTLQTQSF